MSGTEAGMAPRTAVALDRDTVVFLALVVALTLIRFIGQHFSIVDLDIEEAQYWDWSRHLAFGYFSKPPLIAWVNALSGVACGSSAECIRAPAPLFYLGTSLLVFLAAKELYDARTALWAGLACALAPGVSFSARIMTTDVPLLFFWALALYAYVRLLRGGVWRWGVVLAVAFGLGLLSKYAMAYFIPGALVAGLVSTDARRLLGRPVLWLALVGGLTMLTPNILWNAGHGFATAGATADYVRKALSLDAPLAFLAAQFAVTGPVTFGALLVLFAFFGSRRLSGDDRTMLAFAVPPLLVVVLNAAYSGAANANWAAPALISAFIVTAAVLVRARWWRTLGLGLAVGVLAQAVVLVGDTVADKLTLPFLGENADIYQRVLGWDDLGEEITALAKSRGAASVAVENRWEESALNYYLRGDLPVYIWTGNPQPTNHFEAVYPLTADAPQPVLFVTECTPPARLHQSFGSVTSVGTLQIETGPTSSRTYNAFMLSGAHDPLGGPPGCQ
jgi:hypothetical protein